MIKIYFIKKMKTTNIINITFNEPHTFTILKSDFFNTAFEYYLDNFSTELSYDNKKLSNFFNANIDNIINVYFEKLYGYLPYDTNTINKETKDELINFIIKEIKDFVEYENSLSTKYINIAI